MLGARHSLLFCLAISPRIPVYPLIAVYDGPIVKRLSEVRTPGALMPTFLGRVAVRARLPISTFQLLSRISPHEARRSGPRLGIRTGFSASHGGLLWPNAQSICPRVRAGNRLKLGFDHQEHVHHRHCALAPPSHGASIPALSTTDTGAPVSTAALHPQSNTDLDPEPNSDLRKALRTVLVESILPAYSSEIILQPQKKP